jgi:hypothetical protein
MEQKSIMTSKGHSITRVSPPPLCITSRKDTSNRPPIQKSFRPSAFILSERTAANVKQATHQESLILNQATLSR